MEFLTYTEMQHIQNEINSQEGQNYPCSNQVVLCGFFGTLSDWHEFLLSKKDETEDCSMKDYLKLKNGEIWKFFHVPKSNFDNIRGYRFYKVKIDSRLIDRKNIIENILPLCDLYCSELEWL